MTKRRVMSLSNRLRLHGLYRLLKKVNACAAEMAALSDEELRGLTAVFRQRLMTGETLDQLLPEAFAAIREASKRTLGLYPYDVQVLGAIALHQNMIAEMKTGEGKTLTAVLPLYLNALEGKGALLVTVNAYLAERDALEMGPVFQFMGLTVGIGVFKEEEIPSPLEKQSVYASDIVYTTSAGLGFDYLLDNLAGNPADKFLRPFHYAIVDEVDAVLLDSAQTPLIISGSPRVQSNLYMTTNEFVLSLKAEEEYEVNIDERYVFLTESGSRYAERYFSIADLYSEESYELNRHIHLALQAQHLYQKDKDYVVMDGKVKLLDNKTGRILEGVRLQSGLHQALETKEGVRNTKDSRAIASVTYQSLFNMFPHLAGMSGTAKVAEDEFIETYRLPVVVIPTHAPIQRRDFPDAIYRTLPEKLHATILYVKEKHRVGQPVLLISGTVEIAEIYSHLLLQEGIAHSVLTAKNTAKEALIIQEAGQKGAVTVATSLAGRGTDIKLGKGVAALGGLAVIGTERMPSHRVDWQLRGRSGSQGDPGESQFFVSLEDELLLSEGPRWLKRYFMAHKDAKPKDYGKPIKRRRFRRAVELAQQKSDDRAALARSTTVQFDESLRVQRQLIYGLRDRLLFQQIDVSEKIRTIVAKSLSRFLDTQDLLTENALKRYIRENLSYERRSFPEDLRLSCKDDVKEYLFALYEEEMEQKMTALQTQEQVLEFYRLAVLRAVDSYWIEQVDCLQQLKGLTSLRSLGQRDTMAEYYAESLRSYQEMGEKVNDLIVRNVMLSTIEQVSDEQIRVYFV